MEIRLVLLLEILMFGLWVLGRKSVGGFAVWLLLYFRVECLVGRFLCAVFVVVFVVVGEVEFFKSACFLFASLFFEGSLNSYFSWSENLVFGCVSNFDMQI